MWVCETKVAGVLILVKEKFDLIMRMRKKRKNKERVSFRLMES